MHPCFQPIRKACITFNRYQMIISSCYCQLCIGMILLILYLLKFKLFINKCHLLLYSVKTNPFIVKFLIYVFYWTLHNVMHCHIWKQCPMKNNPFSKNSLCMYSFGVFIMLCIYENLWYYLLKRLVDIISVSIKNWNVLYSKYL